MNTKSKTLRLQLAHLLRFYSELITDKGVLAAENEFEVGTEVFTINDEGEFVPAADGEYVVDQTVYTVSAGVITAITVNEKPVTSTEETATAEENLENEETATAENENLAEQAAEQTAEETPAEETDEHVAELEAENETLRARVTELETENETLRARVTELEGIIEEYRQREQTTEPSVEEEDLALAKQEPVKKEDNVSRGVALMRAIRGAKGE